MPSASKTVADIMRADFQLTTEEVMKRARSAGLTNPDSSLRQIIHTQRSQVRRERAKADLGHARPLPANRTPVARPAAQEPPKSTPPVKPAPAAPAEQPLINAAVLQNIIGLTHLIDALGGPDKVRNAASLLSGVGKDLDAYLQLIAQLAELSPE